MPFDASVGGANSNSYRTVADADIYFASRPYSTLWTNILTNVQSTKESFLMWATRLVDAKIKSDFDDKAFPYDPTIRKISFIRPDGECFICWNGVVADSSQALAWPRIGMFNKNKIAIPNNIIPQQIGDVVCELILLLLAADRTLENPIGVQGITGIKAGPIELKFKNDIENAKILPISVIDLLVPSWYFVFVYDDTKTRVKLQVL